MKPNTAIKKQAIGTRGLPCDKCKRCKVLWDENNMTTVLQCMLRNVTYKCWSCEYTASHQERLEEDLSVEALYQDYKENQLPSCKRCKLSTTEVINFNIQKKIAFTCNKCQHKVFKSYYTPYEGKVAQGIESKHITYPVMKLHEEIEEFYTSMKLTQLEIDLRQDLVERLTRLFTNRWPHVVVETFGSFPVGLSLPNGDVDIVAFGHWDKPPLFTTEAFLKSSRLAMENSIKVLDKAKVPIVKFVDSKTGLKVDICYNQYNGLQNVTLMQEFTERFPEIPKLALVLKQFLLQRGLNEVFRGGLGSSSLVYMIVSMLQTYPRKSTGPLNLGVLLTEFFELYGRRFNYKRVGIDVVKGAYIQRAFQRDSFLWIENPFQANENLAKSFYGNEKVVEAFDFAFVQLHNILISGADHASIPVLERVVMVDEDALNYREWVRRNFRA